MALKALVEMEKTASFLGRLVACPPGKTLKSGPLRMHFQHSGAKISGQNADFIIFWLFYSVT